MGFFDLVEMLGEAVDAGLISRADAARELIERSPQAKLTESGAAHYLGNHRTARADARERMTGVEILLGCFHDLERAKTPEEEAAAGLRLEAEAALQKEAMYQRSRRQALGMLRRLRER
ncbi:hypothetical protein ACFHW2_11985 [Actinomadura sp. LOL_016]|uniref:hypothetical protein n=1 Tax=unclassified Actinomadura TaxID=2626254 RepID=UPI003A810BEA